MKKIKKYFSSDIIFFSVLLLINIVLFLPSFRYQFFLDDYFFLNIGRADTFTDIINFFAPGKVYFYRPLTTEFFYYIIHLLNENTYITHWIIWIIYLIGLYYLYKSIELLFKSKNFARLFIFLYSIHFTHVFQLYHIATFIEVALFTLLTSSFYYFITEKYKRSILLYICALLSKETAILYPVFLGAYLFLKTNHKFSFKSYLKLIPFIVIGAGSILLFKSSVAQVAQDEITYAPHFSPSLIINNTMWYTLWAIGLPNYLPNYLQSILLPPIPDFWRVMKSADVRYHLYTVLGYICSFSLGTILLIWKSQKKERLFLLFLFTISVGGFLLFISPTLMIIHKWMVRLTLPLIFLILFQSYILYALFQKKFYVVAGLCVGIYIVFNYYGVIVHEKSSNFHLENRYVMKTEQFFKHSRTDILNHYDTIYFQDTTIPDDLWGESKKLEITFHGIDFLDHYFPEKPMKVIWGYKDPTPPRDAYVIPSRFLMTE